MIPSIGFPALPFPSLHGKVWMSSVFSFPFVSVSPWLFTVARVIRWTGSFFIYAGMFTCTDAYVGLYMVRESTHIGILTTADRICPYTLCAKAVKLQRCVLFLNSRVVRSTLLCLCVCYCCLSCCVLAVRVSYHGAGFSSFGRCCSLISFSFHFQFLHQFAFFFFVTSSMRAIMTLLHCDRMFHVR